MAKVGTALDPQFWPTVATVIPVLALAIVIEARAIVARWGERKDNGRTRIVRTLQGFLCLLWITPLISSIYLEDSSFEALEDEKVSHTAVSLVGPTVALSLAVLVTAPAIELLIRSNARIVALLFLTLTRQRAWWRWQLNVWSARKILRTVEMNLATTYELSAEINKAEAHLKSFNDPAHSDYVRRTREKINEERIANLQRRRGFTESEQRVRDLIERAVRYRGQSKDLVNEKDMSDLENAIMKFTI